MVRHLVGVLQKEHREVEVVSDEFHGEVPSEVGSHGQGRRGAPTLIIPKIMVG